MRSFRDAPGQGSQGRCGKSVGDSARSSDSGALDTTAEAGDDDRFAIALVTEDRI
jgi:hypothetical protein